MRTAFIKTLTAIAQQDPSVMLLTGDLGFTVFEQFRDTLPNQYLNAGVSEQNMMSVATGLALSGRRVFAYSIIPFAVFRCLEQIRDDICYHNVPVCIVGVGGGYSYGHMGATHHALEDVAVLRSIPNISVVCPGDPWETESAVRAITQQDGPCYLRLGKAGEPVLHTAASRFTLGKGIRMREGSDVTLIAMGNMLENTLKAADILAEQKIAAGVISMHTVKPLDTEIILRAAEMSKLIVTVEEHSIGGLGTAVAETLALQNAGIPFLALRAPDAFAIHTGSQQSLRAAAGLDPEGIAKRTMDMLGSR